MIQSAPVYIVDDDQDDREFIQELWKELGYQNELLFFSDGVSLLKHMKVASHIPFLILCDINIPKMDGFELKKQLLQDEDSFYKSIPFVFWSSQASMAQIKKSYELGGNGFFIKDSSMNDLRKSFSLIMEYWMKSKIPE